MITYSSYRYAHPSCPFVVVIVHAIKLFNSELDQSLFVEFLSVGNFDVDYDSYLRRRDILRLLTLFCGQVKWYMSVSSTLGLL